MFGKKSALILELRHRVQDLEERLCPCQSHEWVLIETQDHFTNYGDMDTEYKYQCKKCGKIKTSFPFPIQEVTNK